MSNEKYLAIDIGGTEIKWAEMDAQFQIYDRGHQKTEVYSSDELLNLIHQIVNSYPSIEGIGLSVPGTVKMHDKDGVVKGGGALQFLDGVRLGRLVEESCQMTAAVLNDGKCGVLGEYQAGALRGCRSGAVLALGTGVGGGIIIDGKILDGCHSFAGEFSFMNTEMFKPFCIERAVGGLCGWHSLKYDVLKEMNQEDSPEIDGRLIFEWIEEGSEPARRGLSQYASRISALILQLQAVIDPECFVIAGGISAREELIQEIRYQLKEILNGIPYHQIPLPEVRQAKLGNDANLYGAVAYLNGRILN